MSKDPDISPAELAWARQHLDYVRHFADPKNNSALYWMMGIALVLGLVVYVVGDQIKIGVIGLPTGWRPDFVGVFLSDVGIALFTSVLVVWLLEVMVDMRKRVNQRYARKIEQTLGVADSVTPDERLLQAIEELKAEVAALKTALGERGEK